MRTEQRETNGLVSNNTTQSTIYRYDDADRLREVEEPGRLTTYTLDEVGNRTNELVVDGNNATISNSILGYNARDQLTSRDDAVANVHVVQTWDPNGNLATQSTNGQSPRIYTYDARDRLIAMTNPSAPAGQTTLAFAYHADGLRREKTTGTTTTRYQYDDQSLLAETNTLGNTLRQFHYSATQLVAQTQAGTTPTYRHYLLDALRSPIALLDLTGTVTARTSYDAFGEVRVQQGTNGALTTPNREAPHAELVNTDDQPIGFTGYLKDSESGLYYAKARYYDPATARFTTEDPEAGKDLEPPSLHRYLYAYANPTAYFDPTGRAGFLTDLRERLNQTDEILREWAAESDGTLGMVAASTGRVIVNIGSVPSRLANLVSDGVAQALPGRAFEGVSEQGSIEFGYTVDAGAYVATHPIQTGKALQAAAVETTSRVIEGDRGAASDMFSFGGELLSGSGMGKKFVQSTSTFVKQLRAIEGVNGKPVFTSPVLIDELEEGFAHRGFAPEKISNVENAAPIQRATLPGMSRPMRAASSDFPPDPISAEAMNSAVIRNMANDIQCVDCNEIAEAIQRASDGKGRIVEVRPLSDGNLNVFENGSLEPGQWYHQVYTDGRYVFDPRLSPEPIPRGDWQQHIRRINPDGVKFPDKPKGFR